MSAPKWELVDAPNWDCHYWRLWLSKFEEYVVDIGEEFQAMHNVSGEDRKLGPSRKTLKAALNDCRRDIKKRRAVLVVAGRAKLP